MWKHMCSLLEFCREKSDGEVDSHAVGLIMTMLSVSYKKAVDIWKMQCLAERELGTVPQKRKPATSVLYPDVPANDQEIFAAMSDVQRNKYLSNLQGKQKAARSSSSRQHTKQSSFKKKAWEQAQRTVGKETDDEDMPHLSSDSDDMIDSDEDFDALRSQNVSKNVKKSGKQTVPIRVVTDHSKTPNKTKQPKQKAQEPRAKKARPVASNLKRNTTQHAFISATPLQLGAPAVPVFSGFVHGCEYPDEIESEEESLLTTGDKVQRRQQLSPLSTQ